MTYKYIFNHLLHPQHCSLSIMNRVFDKIDVQNKMIIDPFCGTGTTILAGLEKNPKLLIGTDIQPDFAHTLRYQLVGIMNTRSFSEDRIAIEYGIDAKESLAKYDYEMVITDPPNPFMILGYSNIRHPRDLHMSGNEVKKYWEPRLVKDNLINKQNETIQYVKELFDDILSKKKELIVNLFATKNGKWSYLEEFKGVYLTEHISGQWYNLRSI